MAEPAPAKKRHSEEQLDRAYSKLKEYEKPTFGQLRKAVYRGAGYVDNDQQEEKSYHDSEKNMRDSGKSENEARDAATHQRAELKKYEQRVVHLNSTTITDWSPRAARLRQSARGDEERAKGELEQLEAKEKKYRTQWTDAYDNQQRIEANQVTGEGRLNAQHYIEDNRKTVYLPPKNADAASIISMADEFVRRGENEKALIVLQTLYQRLQHRLREGKSSVVDTKTYDAIARRAARYAEMLADSHQEHDTAKNFVNLASKCEGFVQDASNRTSDIDDVRSAVSGQLRKARETVDEHKESRIGSAQRDYEHVYGKPENLEEKPTKKPRHAKPS